MDKVKTEGPRYVSMLYTFGAVVAVDMEEEKVTVAYIMSEDREPAAGTSLDGEGDESVSAEHEARAIEIAEAASWPTLKIN